jgi:hypothetical protein
MMRQSAIKTERGAIIIHVAIALIVLLAFTSFVVDYGIMWVSRRQAQNAADAGALAAAISQLNDTGGNAAATLAAEHWAANNAVWGQATPAADVDVAFSGPGVDIQPCGETTGCVRVDVFRGQPDRSGGSPRGNPLPTYFSRLVGLTEQGVRATATAQWGSGNQIKCLLPFAVIDRWADNFDEAPDPTYFINDPILDPGVDGWSPNDKFMPGSGDVYIPPYGNNPLHNGWTVEGDYGRQLILKDGSPGNYSAGWANEIDLPGSTGSQDFKWNIEHCNERPVGIALEPQTCPVVDEPIGCVSIKTGVSQGPTSSGIGDLAEGLVSQDPAAKWDPNAAGPGGKTGAVVGGGGMSSPRIRPIVIIDINHYIAQNEGQNCSGTTCVGKVANIIGFFAEGMCEDVPLDDGFICDDPKKDVVGRIVTIPGTYVGSIGNVDPSASFVNIVRLVR